MGQADDRPDKQDSDRQDSFHRKLKTFLFDSVYEYQRTDWSAL